MLWTRITTGRNAVPVTWEVARDPAFRSIVSQGRAIATADRDHTVKVVPDRLQADTRYHFRFHADGATSATGSTRTLAVGRLDRLGIALVSCSNYALGYFNAYAAIADDPSIDFVLHSGDYIYEHGNAASRRSTFFVRPCQPDNETVTLQDYRLRHATHKSDPQSQRMHAAHPMLALWDDHEVANDSWQGGAEGHHPDTQGSWEARRAAAVQAYFEWMPVREPASGQRRLDFWRTYRFGDLASLVTLETRLTARSQQVDLHRYRNRILTRRDGDAFVRDVLGDPARQMMGAPMKAALAQSISASVSMGQPWRLIGNGTLLSRILTPDLRAGGLTPENTPSLSLLDRFTDIMWRADRGLPQSLDSWDGYAGAREQFFQLCRQAGATDLLVLTGDSHSFWSSDLADAAGRRMGIELGTAGITMPNDYSLAGCDDDLLSRIDALYLRANENVRWTEGRHRGYVRVILDPARASVDFVGVQTKTPGAPEAKSLRSERIEARDGTLVRAAAL